MASEENVAGIIPKMAKAPGLWPDVFHETDEEYVLVASTHHVRLKICEVRFVQSACHVVGRVCASLWPCEALLNKGYIQNNGGNLARVSPNWFQSLLQMFR